MNIERRLNHPRGLIGGVAAALAEKFGWSCLWTRLVWLGFALFHPLLTLLVYVLLGVLLDKWRT